MVHWFLSSFVSATLQVLLQKLGDLGVSVYQSYSNVDDKLKKLERTLFRVQALIHGAEDEQRSDMAWQVSLRHLEELAYDADDLIDEIAIEVIKLDGGNNDYKDKVCNLLLSLYKRTSAPNMNYIQVKLDGLLREMELFQGKHLSVIESELMHSSLTDVSHVFGMEKDKKELTRLLLTDDSCVGNGISVVAIVGMMGVGKTTLAQVVYNYGYQNIEGSFQLKMWVSVTKDFNLIRLTRSIIEAATGKNVDLHNMDPLQIQLRHILQGKKFLLVLDDLWNEKRNEWDLLLKPLRHGSKGSRIVVTTRSQVVSSLVCTDGVVNLKCLSDQDCWSLLKHEALGGIKPKEVSKLEAIGEEIAKKCRGLPLAAKTLGSLLHSNIDEDEWEAILKSEIWDLPEVKNEIVPALRLSYHHLPSHLKQCFAYCSMFPQSYEFEKDKIVQMWIAEGFIPPPSKGRIEDTGDDYLNQLVRMSFFQKEGQKYKMHDAIHYLAQSVSSDKFFKMVENNDLHKSRLNRNTRHSSLLCENTQTLNFEAFYKCKSLRTFLLMGEYGHSIKEVPSDIFLKLGRLRVLDLSRTQIEELCDSIGKLKHLRFLDLSMTPLLLLPNSTHELCSLHTLRLRSCLKLLCLPKHMRMLRSLRHLELDRNNKLTSMPSEIGKLTGLQTLSVFIVGPECGIKELKDLNNIRGSLCIKQLEKVSNPEEAEEAKLVDKESLERLELQWSYTVDPHHGCNVLTNLKPHEGLRELKLRKYGGGTFPTWVSNPSFSKLTDIFMYECENCVILPLLGRLPKLKTLKIVEMRNLENVNNTFCGDGTDVGFPSLQTLEFSDMPSLKSWSGLRENAMASLRVLTITKCPLLIILPSLHCLGSLQDLEFNECPSLPSLPNEGLSSSIQSLVISECPKLKERCSAGGEDWTKIKDIPIRVII